MSNDLHQLHIDIMHQRQGIVYDKYPEKKIYIFYVKMEELTDEWNGGTVIADVAQMIDEFPISEPEAYKVRPGINRSFYAYTRDKLTAYEFINARNMDKFEVKVIKPKKIFTEHEMRKFDETFQYYRLRLEDIWTKDLITGAPIGIRLAITNAEFEHINLSGQINYDRLFEMSEKDFMFDTFYRSFTKKMRRMLWDSYIVPLWIYIKDEFKDDDIPSNLFRHYSSPTVENDEFNILMRYYGELFGKEVKK